MLHIMTFNWVNVDPVDTENVVIGSIYTNVNFNLTPDGIPRFPYVIGFRAGRGMD